MSSYNNIFYSFSIRIYMQNSTKKKLSYLESVPGSLKLEMFSFLAAKDKKIVSAVSHDLKKVADTLTYGPFHMVGNDINIGTFHGTPKQLIQVTPRHHIP